MEEQQVLSNDQIDERALLHKFRRLISAFSKDGDIWNERRKKIQKIYRSESTIRNNKVTFNILWSNVQVLLASCFSRLPKVVCERRFKDKDPLGLLAAKILERATSFSLSAEENNFYFAINDSLRDRLLGGIGQTWVRYEPLFQEVQDEATQLDAGTSLEQVSFEEAVTDHIKPWDWGFNSNAREWREVRQVWKKVRLSKDKLKTLFPDAWDRIPLDDYKEEYTSALRPEGTDIEPKGTIVELWDKETKTVYWFTEGTAEFFLKTQVDPLRLKTFFPTPRPLFASLDGESLFPIPDFFIYEELARQLDDVNRRMADLTQMVRLTGVHSGEINENLEKLRSAPDGYTIPIANWSSFQQGKGFVGMMQWIPIGEVAGCLQNLETRSQSLIQKIYEITGMSDIIRGASNPYETLGAQKVKDQWASKKIQDRQQEVQRFIKDILELKAEIIRKHFSDETIVLMAGVSSFSPEEQALAPQAIQLLRDDDNCTFRISIETDSTIEINESEDKTQALEAVSTIANLCQQAGPIMQVDPTFKVVALQAVAFAVRRFRSAREIESFVQNAVDKALAALDAPPPPPAPSPEEQKMQMDMQMSQMKMQLDTQMAQNDMQVKQFIAQKEAEIKEFKAQNDIALKEEKLAMNMQMQEQKLQAETAVKQAELYQTHMQTMTQGTEGNQEVLQLLQQILMLLTANGGAQVGGMAKQPVLVTVDAKEVAFPQPPTPPPPPPPRPTKKIVRLSTGVTGVVEEIPEASV